MAQLYFVRHGETDWNRQRLLQGHTDIALNNAGKEQASALVPFFAEHKPDQVLSSDLARALQTAQIALGQQQIPTSTHLREIFLGEAEGLTREQINQNWPDLWARWSDQKFSSYTVRFPGGENRREGLARFFELLNAKSGQFGPSEKWVFFTHGLILRSFAQWCANIQTPSFTTPNCCTFEFSWSGGHLDFATQPHLRPRFCEVYLLPDEALIL